MKIKKVLYDLKKNRDKLEEIFGKEEAAIIVKSVEGQRVLYNMEKYIRRSNNSGMRKTFDDALILFFVNNLLTCRNKERRKRLNDKYLDMPPIKIKRRI